LSEAFAERLPVSASIDVDQFAGVKSPLGRAAVAAIDAAPRPDGDVAQLLDYVVAEIIPAVVRSYDEAFSLSAPHCDGPFRVVLDRALTALEGDREVALHLLSTLRGNETGD
jgi:hypothetical protein